MKTRWWIVIAVIAPITVTSSTTLRDLDSEGKNQVDDSSLPRRLHDNSEKDEKNAAETKPLKDELSEETLLNETKNRSPHTKSTESNAKNKTQQESNENETSKKPLSGELSKPEDTDENSREPNPELGNQNAGEPIKPTDIEKVNPNETLEKTPVDGENDRNEIPKEEVGELSKSEDVDENSMEPNLELEDKNAVQHPEPPDTEESNENETSEKPTPIAENDQDEIPKEEVGELSKSEDVGENSREPNPELGNQNAGEPTKPTDIEKVNPDETIEKSPVDGENDRDEIPKEEVGELSKSEDVGESSMEPNLELEDKNAVQHPEPPDSEESNENETSEKPPPNAENDRDEIPKEEVGELSKSEVDENSREPNPELGNQNAGELTKPTDIEKVKPDETLEKSPVEGENDRDEIPKEEVGELSKSEDVDENSREPNPELENQNAGEPIKPTDIEKSSQGETLEKSPTDGENDRDEIPKEEVGELSKSEDVGENSMEPNLELEDKNAVQHPEPPDAEESNENETSEKPPPNAENDQDEIPNEEVGELSKSEVDENSRESNPELGNQNVGEPIKPTDIEKSSQGETLEKPPTDAKSVQDEELKDNVGELPKPDSVEGNIEGPIFELEDNDSSESPKLPSAEESNENQTSEKPPGNREHGQDEVSQGEIGELENVDENSREPNPELEDKNTVEHPKPPDAEEIKENETSDKPPVDRENDGYEIPQGDGSEVQKSEGVGENSREPTPALGNRNAVEHTELPDAVENNENETAEKPPLGAANNQDVMLKDGVDVLPKSEDVVENSAVLSPEFENKNAVEYSKPTHAEKSNQNETSEMSPNSLIEPGKPLDAEKSSQHERLEKPSADGENVRHEILKEEVGELDKSDNEDAIPGLDEKAYGQANDLPVRVPDHNNEDENNNEDESISTPVVEHVYTENPSWGSNSEALGKSSTFMISDNKDEDYEDEDGDGDEDADIMEAYDDNNGEIYSDFEEGQSSLTYKKKINSNPLTNSRIGSKRSKTLSGSSNGANLKTVEKSSRIMPLLGTRPSVQNKQFLRRFGRSGLTGGYNLDTNEEKHFEIEDEIDVDDNTRLGGKPSFKNRNSGYDSNTQSLSSRRKNGLFLWNPPGKRPPRTNESLRQSSNPPGFALLSTLPNIVPILPLNTRKSSIPGNRREKLVSLLDLLNFATTLKVNDRKGAETLFMTASLFFDPASIEGKLNEEILKIVKNPKLFKKKYRRYLYKQIEKLRLILVNEGEQKREGRFQSMEGKLLLDKEQ